MSAIDRRAHSSFVDRGPGYFTADSQQKAIELKELPRSQSAEPLQQQQSLSSSSSTSPPTRPRPKALRREFTDGSLHRTPWDSVSDYGFEERPASELDGTNDGAHPHKKQVWQQHYHSRLRQRQDRWDRAEPSSLFNRAKNHRDARTPLKIKLSFDPSRLVHTMRSKLTLLSPSSSPTPSDEEELTWDSLKSMVRAGIPSEQRGDIWFRMSKAQAIMQAHPGYYTALVSRASYEGRQSSSDHSAVHIQDIRKDLDRTFPNHPLFRPGPASGLERLERILLCFALHNSGVGYCQSMNFLVGILMLFIPDEERVFWVLVAIVERILPADYYTASMIGVHTDMAVLSALVKDKFRDLHDHFESHGLELAACCCHWFLTCFVNVFPIETTLRVWDALFFEGNKVLFRVGLALLKRHRVTLLRAEGAGPLMMAVQQVGKADFDCDGVMQTAFSEIGRLSRGRIGKLRKKHLKPLRAEFERRKAMRDSLR